MPKPAIPTTLRIGPHTYDIRHDPETAKRVRAAGHAGNSEAQQLLIQLDTDQPHTQLADTLIHESLHCMWNQTSLPAGLSAEEEAVVLALSPLLLGMLRDNPELVAYLTA